MEPSDLRLLRGVREKISKLAGGLADPEQEEMARTIGIVVDELLKRQQIGRFREFYERAGQLLRRGVAIIGPARESARLIEHALAGLASPEAATLRSTFTAVSSLMAHMVDALEDDRTGATRQLLADVVAWESELSAPFAADSGKAAEPGIAELPASGLETYLRDNVPGWDGVRVDNFRRLPGGYSKVTILFDTVDPVAGRQSFVLRAEQPGTPFFMYGSDIACEYPALRYMFEKGVPVAEPVHVEEDAGQLGARFLISRRAPGRNYGSVISSSAEVSPDLVRHLVGVLARIHATPIEPTHPEFRRSHFARWSEYPTLSDFTAAYLDYWTNIAAKCGALSSPSIRRGLNWLRANRPAGQTSPVLVHGDFGLHNVMIEAGEVSAVLDWEASHLGDPADEFFLFAHALSGVADRPTLMRWYEEAGGQKIDEYRLRYFDIIGCLKGPIVGYGSLALAEQNPDSDIKTCLVGLQYIALPLQSLNALIELAEAARKSPRQ